MSDEDKKKRVTKSDSVTTEVVNVVHTIKNALLQDRVIGMTIADAEAAVLEEKKMLRITREDDSYYVATMDFDLNRLNVEVEKGVVVRAAIG